MPGPALNRNPLSFPQSSESYSSQLFQNPSVEYRGSPLWSWNCKLRRNQLLRGIDALKDMGFGGFHIHSRIGLDTPYMGEEFMGHVRACADYAAEKGLLCYLYDEDRWPSGYAGGLVTEGHPEHRAQHLLLTTREYGQGDHRDQMQGAHAGAVRSELGTLLARYEICLDETGSKVVSAHRLQDGENATDPRGTVWYAYLEPNPPSEWYNGGTYIDTLSSKAVERFIETTHEKYATALGEYFGSTVPSIFTDEPQFAHKVQLLEAAEQKDVFLPWSGDFGDTFQTTHGYDLLDRVPELIWDITAPSPTVPSSASQARYHFHDHVCERFVEAFMDNIARWCRAHGILLIGHMMKEPTLLSQTQALGEAMRCYRSLDVPGVDILTDLHEYNTVKQCTSVAHQNGVKGSMSEIYGVTGWTFDFAGHKSAGDWQAALGITFRVHHLAWVSMLGEGKRDFPAAISYQSNWYQEYSLVEDHFARLNTVLTRGKPCIRVAVIHPIESYWLCFGPLDTNRDEIKFRDEAFADLTKWLLYGLIDFDFVSESMLPSQSPMDACPANRLCVGEMEYEAVVVPNLRTIRSTTLERLRRFAQAGGKVIIAGDSPSTVDGQLCQSPPVIERSQAVQFTGYHILQALDNFRDLRVTTTDEGVAASSMMYNMRDAGDEKFLFICNVDKRRYYPTTVEVRGNFDITVLDTMTGSEYPLQSDVNAGWTSFRWHFEAVESLLLRLTPRSTAPRSEIGHQDKRDQFCLRSSLRSLAPEIQLESVKRNEPNVLLLDRATWKLKDDKTWNEESEIYHAENAIRRGLKIPQKMEAFRQPWTYSAGERAPVATVLISFEFSSTITAHDVRLVLEEPEKIQITLDGVAVDNTPDDWWVDEDIRTIPLPVPITPGKHTLQLAYEFGILTNLERVYLLGEFGVEISGRSATIVSAKEETITFGDWTAQGLPFYAGNLSYHCSFRTPEDLAPGSRLFVEIPQFSAPLVTVHVDGIKRGAIFLNPRTLEIGQFGPGETYQLELLCYGNRENAFGPIHKPSGGTRWIAANTFRAEHGDWMDEFNMKPMGVLQRPRLKTLGKEVYHVHLNPTKTWIL